MAKAENKDTPETEEYAEDIWLDAIAKFPDTKPLAGLLRSSAPMPPAVRDLLAEYLDPSGPDLYRLVYEPTGIRQIVGSQADGDAGMLSLVHDYSKEVRRRRWRGEKSPSRKTDESVGKRTDQSGRSVSRNRQAWKEIAAALRRHFYGRRKI